MIKKIDEINPTNETTTPDDQSIGFWFHVVTMSVTATIIFFVVYRAIVQPTPRENFFLIQFLTPQKINSINSQPTIVKTGFLLSSFRQFDVFNNNFECEGTLWFEYDPVLVALETISKFSFKNAEIKHKDAPKTELLGNKIVASFDVVIHFNTEFNYQLFPMDDHMLALVMVNKAVTPYDIIFESDKNSFIIEADTSGYGWKRYFSNIETGYVDDMLDSRDKRMLIEHPAVQYSLFFARTGLKYTLILLLPMLLLVFVMLTSFSYDPKKYFSSILVANGASLSGLIGYRFVIENMSPKVGYFMISDYIFLSLLAIAGVVFLISIFSAYLTRTNKILLILMVHGFLIVLFVGLAWYILSFPFYSTDIL